MNPSPFHTEGDKLCCKCGNTADNNKFGFVSGVVQAFVCTESEDTDGDMRATFSVGSVVMNVCCRCGAVWPMGDANLEGPMINYTARSSSCPVFH